MLDGINHLIHELLCGNIHYFHIGVLIQYEVADGMEEVGLSQPYTTIDEEGIIPSCWSLSDCQTGCLGKAITRTNYKAFSDQKIFKQTFGVMVTAPALVLGGLFSAFYVPSSYRFDDFFRDGSHPVLDHLIATETMETIHEGSHLKRTE